MNKKFIASSLIILVLTAISWIYQAYKFEQYLNNEYLPFLAKNKDKISYESIDIDKFKFKVIFNKVKLFQTTRLLSFYSDQVTVRKTPYINQIQIDSYGNEGNIDNSEDILYAPSHHITFNINKPFFASNNDNLVINIKSDKFHLFNSRHDIELLNFDNYVLGVNRALINDDTYIVNIISTGENIRLSNIFREFIVAESIKLLSKSQNLPDSESLFLQGNLYYLLKLDEITGPAKENYNISFTYPKDLENDIKQLAITKESKPFISLTNEIFKKKFDVTVKGKHKNNIIDSTLNIKFNNNENSKLEFDCDYLYNYTDNQKSSVVELTSDYLQKVINRDFNKFFSSNNRPILFIQSDFEKLISPMLNIRNFTFSGLFDISNKEGIYNYQLKSKANNFVFEFNGNLDSIVYQTKLILTHPQDLLKLITNYMNTGVQPIITKMNNKEISNSFEKIINSLDQFGPEIIRSLNSEPLQNDILAIEIKTDKNLQNITINNHDFFNYLQDPAIQAFLNSLTPNEPNDNLNKNVNKQQ